MNFVSLMLTVIAMVSVSSGLPQITPQNNCVSFSVGPGTGCSWMCSYCADQLGTNNYYFTDGVCSYQQGGCSGNPIAGHTYTCCSSSDSYTTCQ
jgi:hypothetical protein